MKKRIALLLALIMALALCSCGGMGDPIIKEPAESASAPASETPSVSEVPVSPSPSATPAATPTPSASPSPSSTPEQSPSPSPTPEEPKTIDLLSTNKMGHLVYAGWEYIPDGVLYGDEYDSSKVIVVLYEYTNYREDTPFALYQDFYPRAYQNGVDITIDYFSWSGSYAPLENQTSTVLDGGTITVGYLALLQDNNPVKLIVTCVGSPDKQSMTISLTESESSTAEEESPEETGTPADSAPAASTSKDWSLDYYIDDFNLPTDIWYISNMNISGTFSNSATTNSRLSAYMLIDDKDGVSIFLFEYGNRQVKNSSEYYEEYYDIIMRLDDDTRIDMTGLIYCGEDRLYIDEEYTDTVIEALCGTGNVMFYIEQTERTSTNYLFTVPTSNFADVYVTATDNAA